MIPSKRRRYAAAASFALALSCIVGCAAEPQPGDVSNQQVVAWIGEPDAPLLLDVRSVAEFEAGHIQGSVNIPHDQLASRVEEVASHRNHPVVVYCERGGRAMKAEVVLEEAGFGSIQHMDGDMAGWRAAGLPTE